LNLNWQQILGLFILAIPIACIARTVVFEEVFREPREYCQDMANTAGSKLVQKFFYLFTCEYCFSHWVTLAVLLVTRYRLMYDDWRGYIVAFFSLIFVANAYLNLYARLSVDIKSEKKTIEVKDKEIEAKAKEIEKLEVEMSGGAPRTGFGTGNGH
jgi:hypothetical protein